MILVFIIVGILFLLVGVGLWSTVGPAKKKLKDPIAEHARMHELGIAHKHDWYFMVINKDVSYYCYGCGMVLSFECGAEE